LLSHQDAKVVNGLSMVWAPNGGFGLTKPRVRAAFRGALASRRFAARRRVGNASTRANGGGAAISARLAMGSLDPVLSGIAVDALAAHQPFRMNPPTPEA
jgi:hypothetical protein